MSCPVICCCNNNTYPNSHSLIPIFTPKYSIQYMYIGNLNLLRFYILTISLLCSKKLFVLILVSKEKERVSIYFLSSQMCKSKKFRLYANPMRNDNKIDVEWMSVWWFRHRLHYTLYIVTVYIVSIIIFHWEIMSAIR